ncbi:hypothetical protein [Hyalangium versicolor]|uniref:hypothetical protein n=1 Tax=Hyalangium versicolor TaxID=2861190 RepID=UPI001CCD9DE6|nr:hypothetical protein [Hyalangium versicolor]
MATLSPYLGDHYTAGVSTARLVLCLTVLASSPAFAQTADDRPVASPETSPSPPPLIPAHEASPPESPEGESIPYRYRPAQVDRNSTRRLVFETLAGAGTGFVAGIAGAFAGFLLVENECDDADCAVPVLGAMSLGIVVGTPLGVYGVGRAMDGHGQYWASLAGTGVGSLVGLGLAYGFALLRADALVLISLFVGPLAGAVMGYEISDSSERAKAQVPASPSPVSSGVRYVPMLSVTRSGNVLGGIVGQF